MDERTWITAKGERIAVIDMTDDHLANTIRLLRRRAPALMLAMLIPMGQYQATAPEGASDAIDMEMTQILAMSDNEILIWKVPPYKTMVFEAARRGLSL